MLPDTKTIIPCSGFVVDSLAPLTPHRKYLNHSGGPSGRGILEEERDVVMNEVLEGSLHSLEGVDGTFKGFVFDVCVLQVQHSVLGDFDGQFDVLLDGHG